MSIGPGHELTHNKKNKFDMFIGNWLLAFSCNCAFAIEHVYGHHKNVGLPQDPVTAKRGDNIYTFILQAIIKEQTNAWKIELNQLKRRGFNPFGFKNRVIIGYLRSLTIVILVYMLGGLVSLVFYLLCVFIGQSLLEVANYSQHYGLVRESGKPILPKHSWNSNDVMSGIFSFNVTKQSAHHERPDARFWELESYPDAPIIPFGYMTMIYLLVFIPSLYHKIMAKKLIDWDMNYASKEERKIAIIQNKNSGVPLLLKHI
jgi:alkane 1-monooxygenase